MEIKGLIEDAVGRYFATQAKAERLLQERNSKLSQDLAAAQQALDELQRESPPKQTNLAPSTNWYRRSASSSGVN